MRTSCVLLVALVSACASTTSRVPVESTTSGASDGAAAEVGDGGPASSSADDGAPAANNSEGGAAEAHALEPAQRQELEALIRRRLEGNLEIEFSELRIAPLGALMTEEGQVAAFRVEADGQDGPDNEEQLLIVVTQPFEGDVQVNTIELGISSIVPGSEELVRLESFEGLRLDHGMIRAEVAVVTSSSEMDTCADCQGRRNWATVRQRSVILCSSDDGIGNWGCSLVPLALDVVTPGFEIDEDGSRHPMDEDDPEPYELGLEIIADDMIRLSLRSGTLPADQADIVGEQELMDFLEGDMLGPDDE